MPILGPHILITWAWKMKIGLRLEALFQKKYRHCILSFRSMDPLVDLRGDLEEKGEAWKLLIE